MRRTCHVILPMLVLLAACQDGSGPDGDRLSRAEALAVAAQVAASGEGAATTSLNASSGAAGKGAEGGPPTTFTHTLESTHPCPSGGQVKLDLVVNGSWDADTRSLEIDLSGRQTHAACAFPHEGVTITVTGDPSIDFAASAAAVNGVPSEPHIVTIDGGFQWSTSDGRSGTCALEVESITDFAAKRRTVEGNVCGHTVTQTTTWS